MQKVKLIRKSLSKGKRIWSRGVDLDMKIRVIWADMKNFNKTAKGLLILFVLAAFLVIPFVDSIACDDCMSPSAGKGVDVKHLCSLCFNATADVNFHDYSLIFETSSSVHEAKSIAFLEPILPIKKPPQK